MNTERILEVEIGNQHGKIKGDIPDSVLDEMVYQCSYQVEGAQHSSLYKRGVWDGRRKLFDRRHKRFPMGLWSRISRILDEHNIEYRVNDKRNLEIKSPIDVRHRDHVKLRDYQNEAIDVAIRKIRSILQVATGGGKTVIASGLIERLKCNTLFLVHTKDLLYQTKRSFEEFLEGDDATIGQIGDGIIDIQPITVATTQTMSKILGVKFERDKFDDADFKEKDIKIDSKSKNEVIEYTKSVDLLIWDEVHRVACDMAYNVSEALDGPIYRVGLSASPWRDDGADIMIEASMGEVSMKVSATYLIENEHLVPPVIKMHRIPSSIPWYEDTRTYDQIYRQEIVDNHERNLQIAKYVEEFMGMDIPTLVLVQQIRHGRILKELITDTFHPIEFLSGRDLSSVRNRTIEEMQRDRMGLIATTIADEGLDIKRLAGLILAGGGKSSTRALQRIGRVLRPFEGKTHALVVDFYDEAKYLRDHAEKRMEIYRTEPGFYVLEL